MNNYIQAGETLPLTVDRNVSSGGGFLAGSLFGVATADVASGDEGEFNTCGVYTLAKTTSQAWTVGQKIYWDDTNHRCDSDGMVGQLIGVATVAADSADTTGIVRLNGSAPSAAEGPQSAVADLTDNSGGATADGTIGVVTAPTALTDSTGGTADGTLSAVGATNGGDVSGTINNNFKELTTAQGQNRTAIVALTDAVKELSTKQNALLAKLRTAGIIASS